MENTALPTLADLALIGVNPVVTGTHGSRDAEIAPLPLWNESEKPAIIVFRSIAATLGCFVVKPDHFFEVSEHLAAEFRKQCEDVGSYVVQWEMFDGVQLLKSGQFRCDEGFV